MAYDFPNAPTIGQAYSGYVWDGEKWVSQGATPNAVRYDLPQGLTANQTAQARANISLLKKNYIVNGAMMISQENGTTAVAANNNYGADQWLSVNSTGIVTATVQQRAAVTPGGSPNRLRLAVTTGGGAGSGALAFQHRVEGYRASDLMFGTANAKTVVLQFGWNSPAGTYSISVRNNVIDRSYLTSFTISAGQAGTDTLQTVTIPGDVTGTWTIDNTLGVSVSVNLTTNVVGVPGWQAGNFAGLANNTVATGNFELFDVGLYEGNVAPPFQVPDYASELALCRRYFRKIVFGVGIAFSTTSVRLQMSHEGLRSAPTASVTAAVSVTDIYTANVAQSAASVTTFLNNPDVGQYDFINFTGLTTGRVYLMRPDSIPLTLSARL